MILILEQDLYSSSKPRIALGLDYITQSPGADVIPAIQERLETLLSHKRYIQLSKQYTTC